MSFWHFRLLGSWAFGGDRGGTSLDFYPPNRLATMEQSTSIDKRKVLSDEPKLSSAALCVTLQHLEKRFRPEYTHQCVENETFQGHRPLESVLSAARNEFPSNSENILLHQSHLHHDQAVKELDIKIQLSPCCRRCQVTFTSESKKRKAISNPALEDSHSNKIILNELGEATKTDLNDVAPAAITDCGSLSPAAVAPMSTAEIQQSIAKALPEIIGDAYDRDYLEAPIGKLLEEHSTQNGDYVLSLAVGSDENVASYHQQVQKLAIWFIENADDVDVSDNQSGSWKVLYLFRKLQDGYALVGYATLFHFNAPFHKPEPGIIIRICQALVLPPFQGQGHGKRMMQCIYSVAHGRYTGVHDGDQSIVQINVEDPAPGFVAMRNKVEMKLLEDHPEWWPASRKKLAIVEEAFFGSIPEAEAIQLSAIAKITPHQIHIVNELLKLKALQSFESTDGRDELERRFRLLVKRRLNKDHREELSSLCSKEEKKAKLATLFAEQFALYNATLSRSKN